MAARLALLLLLLLPGLAWGQARVGVRVGDHAGHGRIVFDWPAETAYRVEEEAGRVVIRFARPGQLDLVAASRRLTRNLRGIEATEGGVTLSLAPGARLRHFRLGSRVVVDLLDPADAAAQAAADPPPEPRSTARTAPPRPPPQPAPPAARAASPAPAGSGAAPVLPAAPPAAPSPAAGLAAAGPGAAPAATLPGPAPAIGASGSAAGSASAPPAMPGPPPAPRGAAVRALANGLAIPVPAEVGAALLRRGGTWLLVLDAPLPLDLGALREGPLGRAEVSTGPQATVLRLPVAALPEPRLARRPDAWVLETAEAPPVLRTIRPELDPGPPPRILLRAARPANTVAVLDPETGGTLLVGTLREGGEATPLGRRAATLEILPTRLGAAILPRADTVTLRALPNGFAAAAGAGASLALGAEPGSEPEAARMTRLFDLPAEPVPALVQRERNATLEVAAAPPLGRGPPRLRNAEALLALGLGPEAQAMVTLAMREDPRLAEDPVAHALRGAAALLAGRLAEADGLLHPRLAESDELALWRGLLAAARGGRAGEPASAAAIAAGLPLLRAWPEPLRTRLAPLAAEALAAGGEAAAARRLLAGMEEDPAFALARARLLEAGGEAAPALAAYETVIRGRDRRARAIAMRRAVELRLASGALDAAGAAAAMESVLAAWRGDAMESEARLRLAELRQLAGDARGAFEALREAEQAFPDLAATLRPRQAEALLAAIRTEPPIAAVVLFDAHAALLPAGPAAEQALAALADRLAALDLVERARAVLRQALARAADEEGRARLGLKLATVALGAGDPGGARAALADTESDGLPAALRRERLVADARALARMGAAAEAAARYREAGPEAAPELAEFLAARQDWAGAAGALAGHLATRLPPAPAPLEDEARRLVARLAALLALAGDEAGLAALREQIGPRMAGGAFEEAFGLITGGRMGGIGDLPRLRQELDLARALPGRLEALRAPPGAAR